MGPTEKAVAVHVREILGELGEDTEREGLVETPLRVAKAWTELTDGYAKDPKRILDKTFEANEYDGLIVVSKIPFQSTCEHHLLPFYGEASIGYLPGENGRVVGLSKLPRLLNCFAHRLQLQERLTSQVANAIDRYLQPAGVGVVIKARHLCMELRGVKVPGSVTTTSCMLGALRRDEKARNEFFELAKVR